MPIFRIVYRVSQIAICDIREIYLTFAHMRKHTGMRPQDIAILIKVMSMKGRPWLVKDLAFELFLSQSEVSESLHRSMYAGLIDGDKKWVQSQNFHEFILYGLRYVFPQQPGSIVRGMPAAHSHPRLQNKFIADTKLVWPDPESNSIGLSIEPFYSKQVKAAKQDESLYYNLCLIDMIRGGKPREVNYAKEELKKWSKEPD